MGDFPTASELQNAAIVSAAIVQIARYASTAVYALSIYDWLLSIEDEYDLILKAGWTSMKAAYLICRYFPLLVYPLYIWAWCRNHSPELCTQIIHPLYGLYTIFLVAPQAVVLLRAYAFTGRKTLVLVILCIVFGIAVSAQIWLFGIEFVPVDVLYTLIGDSGCFANDAYAGDGIHLNAAPAGTVFLASFFLDLIIMLIIVCHAIRIRSSQGSLGQLFIAQGLTAFAFMSSLNLISAIIYFRDDRQFDGIGLPLVVVSNVLTCRLILALRRHVSPTESQLSILQSKLVRDAVAQLPLEPESDLPQRDRVWNV